MHVWWSKECLLILESLCYSNIFLSACLNNLCSSLFSSSFSLTSLNLISSSCFFWCRFYCSVSNSRAEIEILFSIYKSSVSSDLFTSGQIFFGFKSNCFYSSLFAWMLPSMCSTLFFSLRLLFSCLLLAANKFAKYAGELYSCMRLLFGCSLSKCLKF